MRERLTGRQRPDYHEGEKGKGEEKEREGTLASNVEREQGNGQQ